MFPCEPASVPVSEGSGFSARGGAKPPEALGSPALVFPFILFFYSASFTLFSGIGFYFLYHDLQGL